MPTPGLLRLPLELREQIYLYCCLPPNPIIQDEKAVLSECPTFKGKQGLLAVCQQIRDEYYPLFASRHSFTMTNPTDFANQYLRFLRPFQLESLRHLTLRWPVSDKKCTCYGVSHSFSDPHYHAAGNFDAAFDIRRLILVLENYPEITSNLEMIELDLAIPPYRAKFSHIDHLDAVSKNVVLLVEAIGDMLRKNGLEERYFVIQSRIDGPANSVSQVGISAITRSIWSKIPDGGLIRDKACLNFINKPSYFDPSYQMREFKWPVPNALATEGDRVCPTIYDDGTVFRDPEKKWKVIFPVNPTTSQMGWIRAMKQLQRWKGPAYEARKARASARKRRAQEIS